MLGFRKHKVTSYPPEIVTNLKDLMRFEFLVQSGNLLPKHPIYSVLAGRHESKLRGRGLDFEEVRQYVAGDDIRNIDWRVTARTGETYSKVFNEEKERPTFIVADQSTGMFFGSQRFVKAVSAAHVAAISAFYTIKRGDRVGGIVFNEEGMDFMMPKRSKAQVQHFLQCVVNRNGILPQRKKIETNTKLLNSMLQKTQAAITHDYVVLVVSDFSNIDDETKQYLRNISQHNDVMLVHIYDQLDQALPDGKLVLSDGKKQISWRNNKRSWGKKYVSSFVEMQQHLRDEFSPYRIPIVFFNTEEAIEDQIMHHMGKILKK
ncbi:DUF58 domain-containing protein [Mucilaginibacter jinjuensis]|uniref:DUF58 domain-containing protein n=1 Tax=Mucilaginibacter jinjuensis TaxID=1176721 RepID=A0ABY7T0M2_9SPHI|nr:DUF58 domain-containing protein [Mucilaginibacter jinjuensis]WCT09974.1 DUF58 domain-containing protein [Mucilaginibacter jinjuensis]